MHRVKTVRAEVSNTCIHCGKLASNERGYRLGRCNRLVYLGNGEVRAQRHQLQCLDRPPQRLLRMLIYSARACTDQVTKRFDVLNSMAGTTVVVRLK